MTTDLSDLNELVGKLWADVTALRDPDTGHSIIFKLKPNQHAYNYYAGPRGEMFCYTSHPDTAGNYWAWTYQPIGKGSRSGDPHQWKVERLVKCARRKTAIDRALKRLRRATGV